MKQFQKILCAVLAAVLLTGCSSVPAESGGAAADAVLAPAAGGIAFTDALDHEVTLESWERVVSLYGSFAETWLLAGGTLAGTTEDAVSERGLDLGEAVAVVGTVKEPGMEEILALAPDFVILSADIASQAKLHGALEEAGIPHAYYRVDAFADYLAMLKQFCELTGREDLYQKNGLAVQERIDAVLAAAEGAEGAPSVLLIRAYSTGAKAKGDDNLAGVILRDLGADNLADRYESLLEDVSLEEVIAADPDFIFITTMGAEDKALAFMAETFEENPAWAGLSAVKNGDYVMLPKELFHYKPNTRWGESYAYLAEILYPELAGQIQ